MRHLVLILLYVGTGTLGLNLGAEGGFATPVWYPSGIAMGLLILWGLQYAPTVAVAAFLTNFLHGATPIMAAMIAFGNMAGALCGAWVLRRRQHHVAPLEDIGRIAELVVVAAIASTIISAINGTFTLWIHDVIASTDIARVFKTWWLGDAWNFIGHPADPGVAPTAAIHSRTCPVERTPRDSATALRCLVRVLPASAARHSVADHLSLFSLSDADRFSGLIPRRLRRTNMLSLRGTK